jgi:hypothetical protein
MKVQIGSVIIGASGKRLRVDSIEGEIIHCGELRIKVSAVIDVEPPSLIDRLDYISTLSKSDAKNQLLDLLVDFSTNDIYESSLDLDTYLGKFIRTQLQAIRPIEFSEIGQDGSEGKYGVMAFPNHE